MDKIKFAESLKYHGHIKFEFLEETTVTECSGETFYELHALEDDYPPWEILIMRSTDRQDVLNVREELLPVLRSHNEKYPA